MSVVVHAIHKGCGYEGLALSAGRPDHLIFFRKHVSRNAVGKGKAVLQELGLGLSTIEVCYNIHPRNEEEAVQEGLIRWCGGKGCQPPTWAVLIEAMEYAGLAQYHMQSLIGDLGSLGMLFVIMCCLYSYVCAVLVCMFLCMYNVYGVMYRSVLLRTWCACSIGML